MVGTTLPDFWHKIGYTKSSKNSVMRLPKKVCAFCLVIARVQIECYTEFNTLCMWHIKSICTGISTHSEKHVKYTNHTCMMRSVLYGFRLTEMVCTTQSLKNGVIRVFFVITVAITLIMYGRCKV